MLSSKKMGHVVMAGHVSIDGQPLLGWQVFPKLQMVSHIKDAIFKAMQLHGPEETSESPSRK